MAKYQVTFFINRDDEYSTVVSCHRDDAIDRALEEMKETLSTSFTYDEVEVEEVKP